MTALPARFWAKVNKTATCWIWTASITTGGYGQIKMDGKPQRAHRVAYEALVGPIPAGLMLDHICFNKPCVNPAHLRLATHKQNQEHRQGATIVNRSTGVCGVTKVQSGFVAHIRHHGRRIYLGTFRSLEEAHAARLDAESRYFTHADGRPFLTAA